MADRDWTHEARGLGYHEGHAVGFRAGRIAGLKEALETIQREVVEWGTMGDGIGDLIAKSATKSISARIAEIEKGE